MKIKTLLKRKTIVKRKKNVKNSVNKKNDVNDYIKKGRFYLFVSEPCVCQRNMISADTGFFDHNHLLYSINHQSRNFHTIPKNLHYQFKDTNETNIKTYKDETFENNDFEEAKQGDQTNNDNTWYKLIYFTDKNKHTEVNPNFKNHIILYGENHHIGSLDELLDFSLREITGFFEQIFEKHKEVLEHTNYFLNKKEISRIKSYRRLFNELNTELDVFVKQNHYNTDNAQCTLKTWCQKAINGIPIVNDINKSTLYNLEQAKVVLGALKTFLVEIIKQTKENAKEKTKNDNRRQNIYLIDAILYQEYYSTNMQRALKKKEEELKDCYSLIRKERINKKIARIKMMQENLKYYNKQHLDFINKHTPNGLETCAGTYMQPWDVN